MAQILVRNLDENIVERLKKRAKEGGRSLQSEVKFILEQAAVESKVDMNAARRISEEFRQRFKGRRFPNTVELIRKERVQ